MAAGRCLRSSPSRMESIPATFLHLLGMSSASTWQADIQIGLSQKMVIVCLGRNQTKPLNPSIPSYSFHHLLPLIPEIQNFTCIRLASSWVTSWARVSSPRWNCSKASKTFWIFISFPWAAEHIVSGKWCEYFGRGVRKLLVGRMVMVKRAEPSPLGELCMGRGDWARRPTVKVH